MQLISLKMISDIFNNLIFQQTSWLQLKNYLLFIYKHKKTSAKKNVELHNVSFILSKHNLGDPLIY